MNARRLKRLWRFLVDTFDMRFLAAATLAYFLFVGRVGLHPDWPAILTSPTARVFYMVGMVGIGFGLYELKTHQLVIYAGIELGVALGVSWEALAALAVVADRFAVGVKLCAALYVIVRAFENLNKGLAARTS
jgi:hypothetical protein